jgi:mannose-6-phosphate isomerase-like protein (cupin superfamily)
MTSWKSAVFGAVAGAGAVACLVAAVAAQDSGPEPQCRNCPATYIDEGEIKAYVAKAMKERLVDQQIRDVEIGKAHVGVGVVYRGKLDKPAPDSVAEHDLVSEVYHIIEGSGTLVTGPELVGKKRRPADMETVRLFNGPGNGAESIRNGVTHQLKAGDVIVIPAGTGHWFTKIDDHIVYLMMRIDPDKATPLKDEAASKIWLATPHAPSR